jgi:hypothetical protein
MLWESFQSECLPQFIHVNHIRSFYVIYEGDICEKVEFFCFSVNWIVVKTQSIEERPFLTQFFLILKYFMLLYLLSLIIFLHIVCERVSVELWLYH